MNITDKRTQIILEYLEQNHYAEFCREYGETGYTNPKCGVILMNWNKVSRKVWEYLEQAGYESEWYDEWTIDYNHSKAYRTRGNSYHWQSQIRYNDECELITPDSDISEWIDYAENNPEHCLPDFITDDQLINEGYTLVDEEFANGWYGKQDDPKVIMGDLLGKHTSIIFKLSDVGQWETGFVAWVKNT